MVRQPAPAVYAHEEFERFVQSLSPDDRIRTIIEDMKLVLKENVYAGSLVSKKQTPQYYIDKYSLNPRSPNLYVYDNPDFYRTCYTIQNVNGLGACPILLETINHKEYDRKFGYRKK